MGKEGLGVEGISWRVFKISHFLISFLAVHFVGINVIDFFVYFFLNFHDFLFLFELFVVPLPFHCKTTYLKCLVSCIRSFLGKLRVYFFVFQIFKGINVWM